MDLVRLKIACCNGCTSERAAHFGGRCDDQRGVAGCEDRFVDGRVKGRGRRGGSREAFGGTQLFEEAFGVYFRVVAEGFGAKSDELR